MQLKFSQDLQILLDRLAEEPLTLEDILNQTAERGFGLVIALLVMPFLLPVPPGLTGFAVLPCIILSLQMALGRQAPWLPRRLRRLPFPKALSQILLKNIHRITTRLEAITRPRLRHIASHPLIWRINGLMITWLAILLVAPIPFTNPIPTIGILLLVVAMFEGDGLLMCFAYGLSTVITAACAGIAYAVFQVAT
jgi:hypothetical protein